MICQTYPNEKYLAVAERITSRRFVMDSVIYSKEPAITIVGFDQLGYPCIAKGPLQELKYRKWRNMYVVRKKYFKTLLKDFSQPMKTGDYLCSSFDN